ncbi:MAG: TrbC/VirB2 family protein [Acidiphilium sp.]|nr:TrbC/VirB2 family protein [Acidiphilium sp.]
MPAPFSLKTRLAQAGAIITTISLTPAVALAAGTGTAMPWDTPLQTIETDLTGPVAKAIGIIAVVLFGLAFAFGEHGSTLRKGLGIIFGLAIAFTATSFVSTFFGFTGGAGYLIAHAVVQTASHHASVITPASAKLPALAR